ncbi:MAG: SsrA-binding protein SmpB [Sedimentisphaerales bacterium]|nr:SsrA-binding protein SmpB [Sedimentisphaerales bacterium]
MTKQKKTESDSSGSDPKIVNKKARFNYTLLEKLEAGMVLRGTEVKSLRQGRASLEEAFCRIQSGELYLFGCNIAIYEHGNIMNHEPTRKRKLLVHKRELNKIESKLAQKGLTMVPLRIYFSRGRAKIEIALASGKTHGDKREKIKDRQIKRDIGREMRKYK